MISISRKLPYAKSIAIFLGAVILYAFLGFLVVPRLIERAIPDYAAERLQSKATVGKVRFHPFLLKLDVRDLVLAEKNGNPIAGVKRLLVDLDVASIVNWAWTFSRINVEGLDLHIDIRPDGRINLDVLADRFRVDVEPSAGASAEDEPPPRAVLKYLSLSGAAITLRDRSGSTPAQATLAPINLELRDLSTLPEQRGPYVLRARLPGGGALSWRGDGSLNPVQSQGHISLKGAKPATVWRFLRDKVDLAEPSGEVDVSARYRFTYADRKPRLELDEVRIGARGIALTRVGVKEPILLLKTIEAIGGRFDLAKREFVLPELQIRDGSAVVAVDPEGRLNWQMLVKTSVSRVETVSKPDAQGPPWAVNLESIRVADLALRYNDRSRAVPLVVSADGLQLSLAAALEAGAGTPQVLVSDIAITLAGIKWHEPGAQEPLVLLKAIEANGGRFNLAKRAFVLPKLQIRDGTAVVVVDYKGRLYGGMLVKTSATPAKTVPTPAAPGPPLTVKLESIRVADVALRYTDHSRAVPLVVSTDRAQVSLSATLEAGAGSPQVLMNDIAITLAGMKLREPGGESPLVTLEHVAVEGAAFDLRNTSLAVKRVAVKGGMAHVVRDDGGRVRIAEIAAAGKTAKVRRELAAALERGREEGRPWRVAVDAVEFDGLRVALEDRSFSETLHYDLEGLRGAVKSIRSDGKTPLNFDAQLRVAQGGSARVTGEVASGGTRADATVKVEGLNLKPLQPLVAKYSAARLESGVVSTAATIAYQTGKARPGLQATGTLNVDDLLLNEASSGERLLAWKSLSTKGVKFRLEPGRLEVKEVRVVEPGAKIVIFKDRSLNLAKALLPPQQSQDSVPAPEQERKPSPAKTEAPLEIAVEKVAVDKGIVDFADLSLILPFAAKVEKLQGAVSGISSDRAGRAGVRLEGQVGEFGLARVEGTLKPFRPKEFMDLGVTFQNVEMPPLSPYSVTFAGRKIASGRLGLDLRYKIVDSKLAGNNKIVLQKFTLGERVKVPGALDLPLDVAVALLTDANGRINIGVPVSGDVNDPKFSFGDVIGQAIAGTITGIVTAPFRMLGALLGGSGENLDTIAFEPGSAAIQPPEREKLKKIAEALAKRPQLKLVVAGQYGEADRATLRQRDIAAAVAAKLGRPVAPGSRPALVNPANAKTQRALETLFVERNSAQALAQFVTELEKTRAKPIQRANPLLAAAGKPSADVAFYEALLKRLTDSAPVPEEAFRNIAQARARAVTDDLVKTLSVPAARVESKAIVGTGGEQVRLALDVLRQAAPATAR
jgi:hypothetical protein